MHCDSGKQRALGLWGAAVVVRSYVHEELIMPKTPISDLCAASSMTAHWPTVALELSDLSGTNQDRHHRGHDCYRDSVCQRTAGRETARQRTKGVGNSLPTTVW